MRISKNGYFNIALVLALLFFTAPSSVKAQSVINIPENRLTLAEAVETALKNNPDVEAMLRSIEKSEYLYRAASKEWLPTVSVDYSFTGFPSQPKIKLEGLDTDGSDEYPVSNDTSFIFGAHVRMPIYTGDALRYRKEMAYFGIDVSKLRLLETKADLIQEVTIDYHNILRLQNYSNVVAENLRRFMEHEDVASSYFEAGLVAKNSVLEIRAKRALAQQDMIEAEKGLKIAKMALNVAMGVDIDSEFIFETIAEDRDIAFSAAECLGIARSSNPSLAVFTHLKKIAELDVKSEKTGLWPQVYGDISYYRHGKTPALNGDDYISNDIVMGMVVADWKVFDWFKTMDLANAKKGEVAVLVARLKGIEDKVSFDIRQLHLEMKAARSKAVTAERSIEYAEENYRIAKLRYDEKVANSLEVNDALALLKQSQFTYYAAFYEHSVAVARLERVIGTSEYLRGK